MAEKPKPVPMPLSDTWRDKPMQGAARSRVDGPAKVSGQATYSYEYRTAGEAAYGWIVGATIATGDITDIDTAEAEKAPGVLAVLTHRNAPKQAPPHPRVTPDRYGRSEPYLFAPSVRWYGEPVALVIAETIEAARDGALLVRARYAPAAMLTDFKANLDKAYNPKKVNAGYEADTALGDFAAAFAAAPVKLDQTYETSYEHNMPMEPHATLAVWEGDKLSVWSPQQGITRAQVALSKTLEIPENNVRVITPFIGGGFGSKVPTHCNAILAALGAKVLGRPVKVAMTRQQMFHNTNLRPMSSQRMRLGADKGGKLDAIAHDAVMQTTPYDEFIEQNAEFSRGLYAAGNRLHTHRGVALNLPTSNIMRAPGEQPGSFAMECAMDELAVALDMDPIELRILNEPKVDPSTQKPFSSRNLVACLREGASEFGWDRRPRKPGEMVDGSWAIGYGVAAATFPTFLLPSSAEVTLNADGTALCRAGATDLGTGTWTVMTQVVAEELGLEFDQVTMELGDSVQPPTAGSGGSFGAASCASGIHMACEALRRKIVKALRADSSSPLRDISADAMIVLRNGQIEADGKSESLRDFLQRSGPTGLTAESGHGGASKDYKFSTHVFGAQFVELGVEKASCEVRIRRLFGAFAAGRILNAKLARSQIIGGMVGGVGSGLTEESVVDPRFGDFINHDLAEYHVPVNADIPEIDAIFLPETEEQANPLGIKGIGEVGIVGVAAAIANAVYNATGARVREAPVTLDRIMAALPKQN